MDTNTNRKGEGMKTAEVPCRRCVCIKCDPTGHAFAAIFGYNPVAGETRKTRRTPEEAAAARRQQDALKVRKAEARARFYAGRKTRSAQGVA